MDSKQNVFPDTGCITLLSGATKPQYEYKRSRLVTAYFLTGIIQQNILLSGEWIDDFKEVWVNFYNVEDMQRSECFLGTMLPHINIDGQQELRCAIDSSDGLMNLVQEYVTRGKFLDFEGRRVTLNLQIEFRRKGDLNVGIVDAISSYFLELTNPLLSTKRFNSDYFITDIGSIEITSHKNDVLSQIEEKIQSRSAVDVSKIDYYKKLHKKFSSQFCFNSNPYKNLDSVENAEK